MDLARIPITTGASVVPEIAILGGCILAPVNPAGEPARQLPPWGAVRAIGARTAPSRLRMRVLAAAGTAGKSRLTHSTLTLHSRPGLPAVVSGSTTTTCCDSTQMDLLHRSSGVSANFSGRKLSCGPVGRQMLACRSTIRQYTFPQAAAYDFARFPRTALV